MKSHVDILAQRRAGILLHPTSLPGPFGNGDFGPNAYRFVDFLAASGMKIWQTLPLGPTHGDGSPYSALSVHAGGHRLISLDLLIQRGWLTADTQADARAVADWGLYRRERLQQAYAGFRADATPEERAEFRSFCTEHATWLGDFALYQALREAHGGRSWLDWPAALRDREPGALEQARRELAASISQAQFEQFLFFRQWLALKRYANERQVLLFGDMPIFVAHDSAEVWAHREFFTIDEHGRLQVVAGVPPDYFSATGQRWGNPHYDWERMRADGFKWWLERMRTQLGLFDLIRIDHFRGFEAYWEIPAEAKTAVEGRWVSAPGDELFDAFAQAFGQLPLVAEDLGLITPEVEALRQKFRLPGMKVLQFAFEGGATNPYLPHNHERDFAVYTGTHDNNTTVGWFAELSAETRSNVLDYLAQPGEPMPWPLVCCAMASVGRLVILPMQDALALEGAHRMNTPSTTQGNWLWRFDWAQLSAGLEERLRRLTELYGR